jgi:hypothetical protein
LGKDSLEKGDNVGGGLPGASSKIAPL